MKLEDLVDRVADRTSGSPGDPLSRSEVETVVLETIRSVESEDLAALKDEVRVADGAMGSDDDLGPV